MATKSFVAVGLVIPMLLACAASEEASGTLSHDHDPDAEGGGLPPAVTSAHAATLADDAEARSSPPRDRGIGIVYFDQRPGSDKGGGADTMLVLRDTIRQQIVARFIFRRDSSSWSYALESREPVESNALEFDYEIEGLPVARASADARWVTVVHGYSADGDPRSGWVKVAPGRVTYQPWPNVLRDRDVFFVDGVQPEFFGSARGAPVEFPLAPDLAVPDRRDYIMHPITVQGEWMKVRVTSPADTCASPTAVRQMMLWIRYLDGEGRPRVWYHARGC